jgi:hypothetical protein
MWVPAEVDRETMSSRRLVRIGASPSADGTDASTKRASQINYQSP